MARARTGLATDLARVRRLARGLGLEPPSWVEVAPVPDASAGVTFSGIIRLQPAPPASLLAVLLHETGHLGPARQRVVEEALADLTRRALVDALLLADPELAAPLLPSLISGLGTEVSGQPPDLSPHPLGPAVYRRAGGVALALLDRVRGGSPAGGSGAPDPETYAAAARLGRRLPSETILELAAARAEEASPAVARRRFLAIEVAGRLRWVVGRLEPSPQRERLGLLAAALEAPAEARGGRLGAYLGSALAGDDDSRLMAHGVAAELVPGAAGEIAFLDAWVEAAGRAEDALSSARALARRGGAALVAGRLASGVRDLDAVVVEAPDPFLAAAAAVSLARALRLTAADAQRLLRLAPALEACGPDAEPLRAHALALAGHHARSLEAFARGAGGERDSWSLTVGWAEALAAAGRPAAGAALLRQRASLWRRAAGGATRAGAALLAAIHLDRKLPGAVGLEAAAELERAGSCADAALAEAAARLAAIGREQEARRAWRRLLAACPQSDHAARAAREVAEP